MKMGDGGFRGAFNVQFATGVQSRVIYGVDVVNTLDPGTSPAMMKKVHTYLDYLKMPPAENWNLDSAYSSKEDVEEADQLYPKCKYNSPPKAKKNVDPKKHQKRDSEAVKRWRDRLGSSEMEEAYKSRCSTAEFSNAQTKNQGMNKMMGRGMEAVLGESQLHAIAHNVFRYLDLAKKKQATATKT